MLVATTRKAVLRAAADELRPCMRMSTISPPYEIVSNPAAQGRFPNLRGSRPRGVAAVMGYFLAAHGLAAEPQPQPVEHVASADLTEDVICDEILLEAARR